MDCKDGKGVLRVDGSRTCGVNWALSDAKRRDDRNRRKRLLNPPTYVKGHEKDANGIVVGKWLYYCAILGKELNTREAALKHNTITAKEIELENDAFVAQTISDGACIEKYAVNFGLYGIKTGAYQGQKMFEVDVSEWLSMLLHVVMEELGDTSPLLYHYGNEGSLVIASLARYGAISPDEIEMTVKRATATSDILLRKRWKRF